jgi:hypothetical protein
MDFINCWVTALGGNAISSSATRAQVISNFLNSIVSYDGADMATLIRQSAFLTRVQTAVGVSNTNLANAKGTVQTELNTAQANMTPSANLAMAASLLANQGDAAVTAVRWAKVG